MTFTPLTQTDKAAITQTLAASFAGTSPKVSHWKVEEDDSAVVVHCTSIRAAKKVADLFTLYHADIMDDIANGTHLVFIANPPGE